MQDSPRLPPRAVPHCFPRVLEQRSSSRDIQRGHSQREGPTAHLDLHHAVNQLTQSFLLQEGGQVGGPGLSLLCSGVHSRRRENSLCCRTPALINIPGAWSSRLQSCWGKRRRGNWWQGSPERKAEVQAAADPLVSPVPQTQSDSSQDCCSVLPLPPFPTTAHRQQLPSFPRGHR